MGPSVAPTPLTSCRSAAVRSGTRLYTWLLSAMGGSASSNRPRGNSRTSSATAARADPGRRHPVTGVGGAHNQGGAILPTSRVTRGEATPAEVLSLAARLPSLPASPLKGSASVCPSSRRLFSPKVSGTRRCLFRLMSRERGGQGKGRCEGRDHEN